MSGDQVISILVIARTHNAGLIECEQFVDIGADDVASAVIRDAIDDAAPVASPRRSECAHERPKPQLEPDPSQQS